MNRIFLAATTAILIALVLFSLGCSSNERVPAGARTTAQSNSTSSGEESEMNEAMAKLSPEDRAKKAIQSLST